MIALHAETLIYEGKNQPIPRKKSIIFPDLDNFLKFTARKKAIKNSIVVFKKVHKEDIWTDSLNPLSLNACCKFLSPTNLGEASNKP
jgi:hypothetical protein